MLIKFLTILEKYLDRKNKVLILATGLLLVFLIGIVDYLIVENIALLIFYLIPITLITWLVSKSYGILICYASTLAWLIAELSSKINNFKQVNDRFGHSTGDLLLKLIVEIASQNIRNTDLFGRMGGDEFVLLLPETNYQAARIVLTRVQQDLLKTMTERSWPVGFSIGAITFINQPNSSEAMLERVDKLIDISEKCQCFPLTDF
jgi:diguanylate cyclase (GGDEF)-like protein